jgi:hypothetical protein
MVWSRRDLVFVYQNERVVVVIVVCKECVVISRTCWLVARECYDLYDMINKVA